jgi:hypothetical protein
VGGLILLDIKFQYGIGKKKNTPIELNKESRDTTILK